MAFSSKNFFAEGQLAIWRYVSKIIIMYLLKIVGDMLDEVIGNIIF